MEFREEITTGNVSLGLLDIERVHLKQRELDESGKCDRKNRNYLNRKHVKAEPREFAKFSS